MRNYIKVFISADYKVARQKLLKASLFPGSDLDTTDLDVPRTRKAAKRFGYVKDSDEDDDDDIQPNTKSKTSMF